MIFVLRFMAGILYTQPLSVLYCIFVQRGVEGV